jgi:hypothetical protein
MKKTKKNKVMSTNIHQTFLWSNVVFWINRCSAYTDYINKDFIQWDLMFGKKELCFNQGLGLNRLHCVYKIKQKYQLVIQTTIIFRRI